MTNKELDKIFDKAFSELKNGSSLEEALLKCQPEQENLAEYLTLAKKLHELPKTIAPQPVMQRKYMLVPERLVRFAWLRLPSMATSISIGTLLLISAFGATGYAASNSLPGQTLFAVKKSAENLQLKFASSPEKKVTLQVEFSKKRLMEAQQVISDPKAQPQATKQAINELVSQTKNTVEAVQVITEKEPSPEKSTPIVISLENITAQQQKLINDIKTSGDTTDIAKAKETTNENVTKLAEIKKYIQVASSERSGLVNLNKVDDSQQTDNNGKETIQGTSTQENLNSAVKENKEKASSTQINIESSQVPEAPKIDPNTVTGSYIIEDPAPQYVP